MGHNVWAVNKQIYVGSTRIITSNSGEILNDRKSLLQNNTIGTDLKDIPIAMLIL